MFNLTHWVREKGGIFPFSKRNKYYFLIDLSLSEEDIWKGIEPTQQINS